MKFIFTFLILSLVAHPAFATTTQYYKLHVPIYTIGSDVVPELKIETALYRSYNDGPEVIGAVLPFYVTDLDSSPNPSSNINPASTMNLSFEFKADKDRCSVVLDVTKMKPPQNKEMQDGITQGDITLGDILEKTVEATEKNLAADATTKRCSVTIKGLEKHPEVKATIKPNSPLFETVLKSGF